MKEKKKKLTNTEMTVYGRLGLFHGLQPSPGILGVPQLPLWLLFWWLSLCVGCDMVVWRQLWVGH
jgi:hypothetical protein